MLTIITRRILFASTMLACIPKMLEGLESNMKLRHCLLSDTESETYMAQYTISYDVKNKRKKLPNLTLLQIGQPSYNLNKL